MNNIVKTCNLTSKSFSFERQIPIKHIPQQNSVSSGLKSFQKPQNFISNLAQQQKLFTSQQQIQFSLQKNQQKLNPIIYPSQQINISQVIINFQFLKQTPNVQSSFIIGFEKNIYKSIQHTILQHKQVEERYMLQNKKAVKSKQRQVERIAKTQQNELDIVKNVIQTTPLTYLDKQVTSILKNQKTNNM